MPGMENESAKFSGENFVRYSGEVAEANEAQVFAWTARCSGTLPFLSCFFEGYKFHFHFQELTSIH
jgi:pre-mRNA-processing factor SLU7